MRGTTIILFIDRNYFSSSKSLFLCVSVNEMNNIFLVMAEMYHAAVQLRYVFDKVNAKEHSVEVIAKLQELKK